MGCPVIRNTSGSCCLGELPGKRRGDDKDVFLSCHYSGNFNKLGDVVCKRGVGGGSVFNSFSGCEGRDCCRRRPTLLLLAPRYGYGDILVNNFSTGRGSRVTCSFPGARRSVEGTTRCTVRDSSFTTSVALPRGFELIAVSAYGKTSRRVECLLIKCLLPMGWGTE